MTLDFAECDRARLARDLSYEGRFFTGVRTTGSIAAPCARLENRYLRTCASFPLLLLRNSLDFGLVFVVGLKPPRSAQPGRAPVRRLTGRCILSGIRREARGLEGDHECCRKRCAPP
jgi:Metal binding domain of Ada